MKLPELKNRLNEIVSLVPEMDGKGFDDNVKLEDILSYLKDSVESLSKNSNKEKSEDNSTEVKKLQKDLKFLQDQLEKKNKQIVDLQSESNTASSSDNDELLKAYGIDENSSELEKINNGFEILIKRSGNERVRIFTDAAMGNLTVFAHDDKAALAYLKEKLPEALEKLGFNKVEGKLKIAHKEALKESN